ncbi:MAG: R3H domain-containing nucleic acid-binding protein [Patescibacteria group bacterium]
MISELYLEDLKNMTKDFFKKTSFDLEVNFPESKEEGVFSVAVKTDDPQILIGEGGQTLVDMQHILRRILSRKVDVVFYLDLDINEYKKKKAEFLKEIARSAAEEVMFSRKEKELSPMRAFERRIIHLELEDRTDIKTESIGEGENRRVVVKSNV